MSERDRWMYVNDYPVDKIGLYPDPEGLEGNRSALTVRDRVTFLPGRVGTISLADEVETEPRRLAISCIQRGTSAANLQTRMRELRQRLAEGVTEIRFEEDSDKVFYCRLERAEVTGIAPMVSQPNQRVRISLLAQDPLIYDRNGTVVGFSSDEAELPLGTAPSFGIIRISGAVTDPVITYKDFRGDTKATLGLTATLGATEWREIDMDKSTIVDDAGANAIDEMSSGGFFSFDAQDAAGEDGPYPTIEVSPDADCDALYRKSWL